MKIGDDVTTIGGILGNCLCRCEGKTASSSTGAEFRVRIEMTKWAIGTKGPQTNSRTRCPAKKEKKDSEEVILALFFQSETTSVICR